VEQKVARIATRAHGVVARRELLAAGTSADEVRHRLRTGALIVEFRGVYRAGHRAPSVEARYMAAVLACGEGAVLSGRAAGQLWGLLKGSPPGPEVAARTERRIKGIKTTRARRAKRESTTWRGIPVTTPARTLVDLAAVLDAAQLARACHEAGVRYGTTPRQVEAVLDRQPSAAGAARLRRVLRGEVRVTLSKLESRFLNRLREAGLPLPQTNRVASGRRVDCRWPEQRLTVELDSYRYHHTCHAWEQDRQREREAHARGDDIRRYTWADVLEEPAQMLAELSALLAASAPPAPPAAGPRAPPR
jgi:very-short-patch-repair endonuclease